jgi:hypothetical protein
MVVVARIAFFLSLICTAFAAAICTWSSVHGRHCTFIHTHTKKKERKKKKKKEKKTRPTSNNGGGSGAKKKEKRISKIVRAAHSTTDNVDYYHHCDTYTYYNTYAALASLDE